MNSGEDGGGNDVNDDSSSRKTTVATVKSKVNEMIATVCSLNTNEKYLSRAKQRVLVT